MSGGWKAEREGAAHHDDEEIRHSGESRNGIQCRLYASWIPVLVFTPVTFFRRNDAQRWGERQFEMSGFIQSRTTLSCCKPASACPRRNLP